jgi:hypothetical protein
MKKGILPRLVSVVALLSLPKRNRRNRANVVGCIVQPVHLSSGTLVMTMIYLAHS